MMDVGKSKSTVNEEKERFIYRGTKRQAGYVQHGNYARPNYNGSYVYGNNGWPISLSLSLSSYIFSTFTFKLLP